MGHESIDITLVPSFRSLRLALLVFPLLGLPIGFGLKPVLGLLRWVDERSLWRAHVLLVVDCLIAVVIVGLTLVMTATRGWAVRHDVGGFLAFLYLSWLGGIVSFVGVGVILMGLPWRRRNESSAA